MRNEYDINIGKDDAISKEMVCNAKVIFNKSIIFQLRENQERLGISKELFKELKEPHELL